MRFGRNVDQNGVAAPVFRQQPAVRQLLLRPFGLRVGQVDLVDRNDDGHVRRAGVVDRLQRLRHQAVVRGNHEHDDVGDGGALRPHLGKRFVAGGVDENNALAVFFDVIGADGLGDAAGFAVGHVGRADRIEQRCFAVIDMAHHGNDGGANLDVLGGFDLIEIEQRLFLERQFGGGGAEEAGDFFDAVEIERLVDGRKPAFLDQHFDDLVGLDAQLFRQFLNRGAVGGEDLRIDCLDDLGLALALQNFSLGFGLVIPLARLRRARPAEAGGAAAGAGTAGRSAGRRSRHAGAAELKSAGASGNISRRGAGRRRRHAGHGALRRAPFVYRLARHQDGPAACGAAGLLRLCAPGAGARWEIRSCARRLGPAGRDSRRAHRPAAGNPRRNRAAGRPPRLRNARRRRRGRRRRLQRRSRDARGRRRRGRRQRRNRPEFRLLNRACRRRRNLGRRPAELRRRRNRLAGHRRKIGTLGDLGDLRNCRELRFFHCRQFFFRRGFRRRLHFRRRHERAAGLRRRGSRRRGCRCRRFPGNGLFLLFQQRRLEAADRRAKRLRSTAANADRREGGSGKRAALRRRRSASGDRPRTFR